VGGEDLLLDAADRQDQLPRSVISPVIATSGPDRVPIRSDTMAVNMVTPADGPSFGHPARRHVDVDVDGLDDVDLDAERRGPALA
jgi:hypothetical protein